MIPKQSLDLREMSLYKNGFTESHVEQAIDSSTLRRIVTIEVRAENRT